MNFPEELKYENIKKEMDKNNKSNFIPNRSIFPHKSLEPIKFELSQSNKTIYTKEYLEKYINSLPKTFEDWIKE